MPAASPPLFFGPAAGPGARRSKAAAMADRYSESPRATRGEILSDARKKIDEQLQRATDLRANPLLLVETEEALQSIDAAARH